MTKIIILIVRKHAGEVDWILPVLNESSKNTRIITIFNSRDAYKSLCQNNDLFLLWKKINSKFFVEKKSDNFVNKMLFKFFVNIGQKKISNFFLKNIYSLNFLKKKLHINFHDIKFIFLTYNNFSYWPNILKKIYNTTIIRFPEAQHIWNYNSKNNNFINRNFYKRLLSDIILLSTNSNFLRNSFSLTAKVIFCGIPKYQSDWIKNFEIKKISKKNKIKNIVVATRPAFKGSGTKDYFSESSYDYIIRSIVTTAKTMGNIRLVFKLHPNRDERNKIVKICDSHSFDNFLFSSEHLIKLAQKSDICLSMYSSAILDFLAAKKPVVEFWLRNVDNLDMIKDQNTWSTVYSKLNLVHSVDSKEMLEKKIKYLLKNPNLSKAHLNNFFKITHNNLKNRKILKKIYNFNNNII